jgi:hypothetical protein
MHICHVVIRLTALADVKTAARPPPGRFADGGGVHCPWPSIGCNSDNGCKALRKRAEFVGGAKELYRGPLASSHGTDPTFICPDRQIACPDIEWYGV